MQDRGFYVQKKDQLKVALQKFVSILLTEIRQYNHLLRIKTQGSLNRPRKLIKF